ncbi:Ldh family oxidoreductase [Sutcliffiella cohnii]
MNENYVVTVDALADFCTKLFQAYGANYEKAKDFSESLVKTELRGIKSHGVVRIKNYIDRMKAGTITLNSSSKIIKETPTTALIDGNNGLGMVISKEAVRLARRKAEESGVGIVSVRNSNHFGAAGIWGEELAGNNMIGICATNSEPIVSAPVGKTRALGSNPFSIAVPANKYPTVNLDISNGVMALGKIYEYRRLGKEFPEGSWLDKEGTPTTNPHANEVAEFIMRPFGMHKGFGITVMMEILTAILADGAFGPEIPSVYRDIDKPNPISHFFMAIKIECFRDLHDFTSKVDTLIEYLHSLPVQEEGKRVLYPGEIEAKVSEQNDKNGIILSEEVVKELLDMANLGGMEISDSPFEVAPNNIVINSQI